MILSVKPLPYVDTFYFITNRLHGSYMHCARAHTLHLLTTLLSHNDIHKKRLSFNQRVHHTSQYDNYCEGQAIVTVVTSRVELDRVYLHHTFVRLVWKQNMTT